MLLLLLSILAAVVLMLFAVASLVNVPGQVAGGVGSQLGGVASQASKAVSGAQQALQSATDPNHPPSGLTYDTEFSALDAWHVGDGLPGGTQYVLTIRSIERRSGTDSPETALYAAIHAELRQPRETRMLGQLLENGPEAVAQTKALALRAGFADLDATAFDRLVESHASKRQSAEAAEGLASFAEKRSARWKPA